MLLKYVLKIARAWTRRNSHADFMSFPTKHGRGIDRLTNMSRFSTIGIRLQTGEDQKERAWTYVRNGRTSHP